MSPEIGIARRFQLTAAKLRRVRQAGIRVDGCIRDALSRTVGTLEWARDASALEPVPRMALERLFERAADGEFLTRDEILDALLAALSASPLTSPSEFELVQATRSFLWTVETVIRQRLEPLADRIDIKALIAQEGLFDPESPSKAAVFAGKKELVDEATELLLVEQRWAKPLSRIDSLRHASGLYEVAAATYFAGDVSRAHEIVRRAYRVLERARLLWDGSLALTPQLLWLYGSIQMQRGQVKEGGGEPGSRRLAIGAQQRFAALADSSGQARCLQLIGLCERQLDQYGPAVLCYQDALKCLRTSKGAESISLNILHDAAVSQLLLAWTRGVDFEPASKLFRLTNERFADSNPSFHRIALIRTGELEAKRGNINGAALLLDRFESEGDFAALPKPYQAIFLRVNAERHLLFGGAEVGARYFRRALMLAERERYTHQLRELTKLSARFVDVLSEEIPWLRSFFPGEER